MEAETLFKDRLNEIMDEQKITQKLLKLLEYLPLAIIQTAALISVESLTLRNYFELYNIQESAPLDLLNEDFEISERDKKEYNAVFKT
jgi:hypothetical protein